MHVIVILESFLKFEHEPLNSIPKGYGPYRMGNKMKWSASKDDTKFMKVGIYQASSELYVYAGFWKFRGIA